MIRCKTAALLAVVLFFTGAADAAEPVVVYLFWSTGCPHCEAEKDFLREMTARYPDLDLRYFEVKGNPENARFLSAMAVAYGVKLKGVPATFIGGGGPIVGFRDAATTGKRIEERIRRCLERGCPDPVERMKNASAPPVASSAEEEKKDDFVIELPLLGKVDASGGSLLYQTIAIAALDGFNPCAFFVLFTLLGLLLHVHSRRRLLLVGGIFVFFSGFIYFIFMAAWLNIFLLTGRIAAVTAAAGAVALIIAAINIKDFFFFGKGISLVIPEKAKPKLFERMRGLMKSGSFPSMVAGTVVLAVAANTYELFCTAGFPMVYTRILTLHRLSRGMYYLYLVLYNAVYVLPLAAIVFLFAVTLGARKLTEHQGRALKLVSGMMMLCLGAVLLTRPELLNNVAATAGLLGLSLAASGIIAAAKGLSGREG